MSNDQASGDTITPFDPHEPVDPHRLVSPTGDRYDAAKLAARVRASAVKTIDAEQAARDEHDAVIGELHDLRNERDAINDRIRQLVDRETTLARVVKIFDKQTETATTE